VAHSDLPQSDIIQASVIDSLFAVIKDTPATNKPKKSEVPPSQRVIGNAVDVKGNMYTFMSLVLSVSALDQIEKDLNTRVTQAPGLFKNMPVIVDFSNI